MRPFFPFYGSKWNTARYYPPPRGRVVEPFAGSAGYALFYDAARVDLFDADPIIAGVWAYLLRVSAAEILSLPELPVAGDTVDNYPSLPQEAKWLIGFWLNRGSAQPKKTRTSYSARTDRAQLNWGRRAKERIAAQLGGLGGWSISHSQYSSAQNTSHDATWFIDPPYGEKGKFYRVPFTSFVALGEWCSTRQGQVIVCENVGASWLPFEPLGSFKSSKGRSIEAIFWREVQR